MVMEGFSCQRKYEMRTLQGDMMTPISVYQSLNGERKMLFESSAKHEESGRYSFVALNPIAEIIGDGNGYVFKKGSNEENATGSVLNRLKELVPVHEETYPFAFFGGAIGYFGYETAFYTEKIGAFLEDELDMPDVHMYF